MTPAHPAIADKPVYLDHNATTPVDPRVAEAMQPYLTSHFGNPSSAHTYATAPTHALRRSREQDAALIGATPDGVVFTGSGSEANNPAIRGSILAARARRAHVITQSTEHPAVLATCRALSACTAPRSPTYPWTATAWSTRPIWPPQSFHAPSSCRSCWPAGHVGRGENLRPRPASTFDPPGGQPCPGTTAGHR